MERRLALVIATAEYVGAKLQALPSTLEDAKGLERVLGNSALGRFEVRTLINPLSHEALGALDDLAAESQAEDLLYVHFSCHGLKDADGRLYFAASNTRSDRLLSTAIPALQVNELLVKARSRRRVLVLDCCYGGAFFKGILPRSADRRIGVTERFPDGRGFIVMTACDALQYAFEGKTATGEVTPSVFTKVLLEGIESGKADENGDGQVGVTELYQYIHQHVVARLPEQRPEINQFRLQGEIFLAQSRNVLLQLPVNWEDAMGGGSLPVQVGTRKVTVDFPAGIYDGFSRRYPGLGLPGAGDLPPGDLVIVFTVAPPPATIALAMERKRFSRLRHAVLGPIQGLVSAARRLVTLAEQAGVERAQLDIMTVRVESESQALRLWSENFRLYRAAKPELRGRQQLLKPVLQHIATMYARILRERNVLLRFEWHPSGDLELSFNSDAVCLALSNLLDNARKFSVVGASVVVGVQARGQMEVAVTVENIGYGVIDCLRGESLEQRLVKPDSLQEMYDQGVGLAVSAAIVRAHGGHLSCQSEPLGEGGSEVSRPYKVRFTFTLPFGQHLLEGSQ